MYGKWAFYLSIPLGLIFGLTVSAAAETRPKVAVSLPPLYSLVAGVMGDGAEPELLIPAGQSPHTYQLRTTTVRTIVAADIVFLVSADFETALAKPISAQSLWDRTVELSKAPGVTVLEARSRHLHDDDAGSSEAMAHEADSHAGWDPHIWLDPDNAIAMTEAIAARLSAVDPSRASMYATNADAYIARLQALDGTLKQDLAPISKARFVVFHDAYQYFERHYGLSQPAIVTVAPDRPPSAKQVTEIRQFIVDTGAGCVFAEPQFAPPVLRVIVEGLDVRTDTLDPLGVGLAMDSHLYPALMTRIAHALTTCLSKD